MLMYACEAAVTQAEVEASNCACELDSLPWPIQDLIDSATDTLFWLSGGVVSGRCTSTVRPCSTGYCVCGGWGCACCQIDGIPLPGFGPAVTTVKIDGAVVPSGDYTIANGNVLARRNGQSWPTSQNPLAADTQTNTFSVTYVSGMPYDFISKMAALELVCEMAKTVADGTGRLPKGTVSASADGVQIVIGRLPGQEEIQAVGLTWLGRFIAVYGNASSPEVRSPELDGNWILQHVP